MRERSVLQNYWNIAIAGGVQVFAYPAVGSDNSLITGMVEQAVANGVRRVILVNHLGCVAYEGDVGTSNAEKRKHIDDLNLAARMLALSIPDIEIGQWLIVFNNRKVRFVRIAAMEGAQH